MTKFINSNNINYTKTTNYLHLQTVKYPHFHKGRELTSVLWLLLISLLKEYSDSADFASYVKLFQSIAPLSVETSFKKFYYIIISKIMYILIFTSQGSMSRKNLLIYAVQNEQIKLVKENLVMCAELAGYLQILWLVV